MVFTSDFTQIPVDYLIIGGICELPECLSGELHHLGDDEAEVDWYSWG